MYQFIVKKTIAKNRFHALIVHALCHMPSHLGVVYRTEQNFILDLSIQAHRHYII